MSLTTLETGVGAPSDSAWTGNPNDDANIIETLKALALKPIPSAPPTFPLEFASIKFCGSTDYFKYKDDSSYTISLSPTFSLNNTGADLTVTVPNSSFYLCFIPLDSGLWQIEFGHSAGSNITATVPNRAYYATPAPESAPSSYIMGEFVFFDSNNTAVFIYHGFMPGTTSELRYGSTIVNCNPYTLFA